MKCVINGLDMDSGLDAWRAKFAADGGNKTLVRKRVQLRCGRSYSLEEYQRAQRRGTEWMAGSAGHAGASATQSVRMLAYIGQCMTPTERRKKNPALKLKSYLLQEAEAVSRGAKAEWAAGQGVRVVSLQHDGVVFHALPDGLTAEEVAEKLTRQREHKIKMKKCREQQVCIFFATGYCRDGGDKCIHGKHAMLA